MPLILTRMMYLQRELAEAQKYQYLSQYNDLLRDHLKLKDERHEVEQRRDNQSDENMATMAQVCLVSLPLPS